MAKAIKSLIPITPDEMIINKIYVIRGQKVMFDKDLAAMYGVEIRILNQAVKRNMERFPSSFMFQLADKEFEDWKSQIVISKSEKMGLRKKPMAFTEEGVSMLSGVLNSAVAIQVHIQIIRIFSKMREMMLTNKDILLKLEHLEKDVLENKQDIALIFEALKKLLDPPQEPRKRIGFKPDD